MGTSHQLIVAGRSVYSMKYEVEPWLMSIFRESDKRVFPRKISEVIGWHRSGDYEETAYTYSNNIRNIIQRLDIMGYSLSRIREEFNKIVKDEIENVENEKPHVGYANLDILRNYTFDDWVSTYKLIIEKNLEKEEDIPEDASGLVKYLCSNYSMGFEDDFPHSDFFSYLRMYLEACPDKNALVYLDITYLVENGFYDPDENVCESALENLGAEYSLYQKIIVLTEGSTDSAILDHSLNLLFPQLQGYYFFMDFGLSNAAGGANTLVNNLKAFIGAGIGNRVIALFDNDTAAKVSLKALQNTAVPNNFKILHYPNLEFAKEYPAIGPSGQSKVDINGLACSIELYLGLDILTFDGNLSPIQWKGYDDSLGQYQGEILNKKAIQKSFFEKLEKCKNDPTLLNKTDWSSIKLIFETIFTAFA